MAEPILFVLMAIGALTGAVTVVASRNPVYSAMGLLGTLFSVAVLYVLQLAHFVAAVQVIVYAGAIVVLFLFVVMLLNLRADDFPPARQRLLKLAATGVGLFMMFALVRLSLGQPEPPPLPEGFGGYREVGIAMYTDYVLLVEVASLLLTAAIVGALILAKRKIS